MLSEQVLLSFRDELRKQGALIPPGVAHALRSGGALAGIGAVSGGGLGAAHGALRGFREGGEDGGGLGSRVLGALSGAAHEGLRSAGQGALVGGLGGAALSHHIDPKALGELGGSLGAGARFGQRQVHALTGILSPKELEGVRGGAFNARRIGSPQGLRAAEAAQNMGLTSLPGYASALRREGVGKVLATSAREQWHNAPRAQQALMLGLPAVGVASALAQPESEEGPGRGERIGKSLGMAAGGLVGGGMPLVGNVLAGAGLEQAGRAVGRGVDRLRGRPRLPPAGAGYIPPPEQDDRHSAPVERVTSPAAAGQPPEGV